MGLLNKGKAKKILNLLQKVLENHSEKFEEGSLDKEKTENAIEVVKKVKEGEEEFKDSTWKRIKQWYEVSEKGVRAKKSGKEEEARELIQEEEKLLKHLTTLLKYRGN